MLTETEIDKRVYAVFSALNFQPDTWEVKEQPEGIEVRSDFYNAQMIQVDDQTDAGHRYWVSIFNNVPVEGSNFDECLLDLAARISRRVAEHILETCDTADYYDGNDDDLEEILADDIFSGINRYGRK
jgi:hypothetical protein